MTLLACNLKTIRKKLNRTQKTLARKLDVGFRTYVRYEAGERDAPLSVLIKMSKFGGVSLEQLLTETIVFEEHKAPNIKIKKIKEQKLKIIWGGLNEGRVAFAGLDSNHLITINKTEKKILSGYRRLNSRNKRKYLINAELAFRKLKKIRKHKT